MKVKLILSLLILLMVSSGFAQRTLNPDNIKTISGTITSVEHPVAKFKADDGTEYDLRMGPYWFWQKNNYSLTNTNATVKGEIGTKNGISEIYPLEIEQNGATIKLSDEKGFPLWSKGGKGWKKGNGKGWKNDSGKGWKKGNGKGWNKGNGKGWKKGQCWRDSDNSQDNSGWQGRGFGRRAGNCPYRNK